LTPNRDDTPSPGWRSRAALATALPTFQPAEPVTDAMASEGPEAARLGPSGCHDAGSSDAHAKDLHEIRCGMDSMRSEVAALRGDMRFLMEITSRLVGLDKDSARTRDLAFLAAPSIQRSAYSGTSQEDASDLHGIRPC